MLSRESLCLFPKIIFTKFCQKNIVVSPVIWRPPSDAAALVLVDHQWSDRMTAANDMANL